MINQETVFNYFILICAFQSHAAMLLKVTPDHICTIDKRYAEAISSVWRDPGMQQCYERRREYQLSDSAKQ